MRLHFTGRAKRKIIMDRNDNARAFPILDDEDMASIAELATCQTFEAGEYVLKFGEADIDLFVVERGTIDILNPTDDYKVVATHTPGMFVGDIDLLTRRPIIIDAVARGDGQGGPTRVLRVPSDKLRHLLNAVPRVGEKLIIAFQVRREALAKGGVAGVRVLGPSGCGHTNRIREFLYKNFVPFTWIDSETPDGRAKLGELGAGRIPAVDCGQNHILHCPTLQELAHCAGVWRGCPNGDVDLAVVGAGPAGIAAAVYAASEGLKTVVLDQLGPGGQAGGSSKIENFIGFPAGLSGTDLATRGVLQMLKFGAQMVAPVAVDRIDIAEDEHGLHSIHTDCGATIRARVILASTGVTWRRLVAKGADRFERAGVYYACTAVEARLHTEQHVAVVGGGNSAGQAAMFLSDQCKGHTVHLLVRRPLGTSMSEYLVNRIRGTANIEVHENTEVNEVCGTKRVESIGIKNIKTGETANLPCGAAFVFIGAEPRTDWLPKEVLRDKFGFIRTGTDVAKSDAWPLKHRDPCPLETTVPRILAGGDVRAGSTKRVGFAVGDGSLAVTCVHTLLAMTV